MIDYRIRHLEKSNRSPDIVFDRMEVVFNLMKECVFYFPSVFIQNYEIWKRMMAKYILGSRVHPRREYSNFARDEIDFLVDEARDILEGRKQ